MRWRHWLVDVPAGITEVGFTWYRLLFLVLLWAAAIGATVGLIGVMASLALDFGFGVRWGW